MFLLLLGRIAVLRGRGLSLQTVKRGMSATIVSRGKTAEPIEMPFGGVDPGQPKLLCVRWGPDPPREGAIFRITLRCSRTLPSTIPSGPDVGISQHAVELRLAGCRSSRVSH